MPDNHPPPKQFLGVTVSSTFTDLGGHRAALIKAINAHRLTAVAMENDSAKPVDVIESSLQMVRDGSAYIGVIGKKYGQTPKCPKRNPDKLSITELEFNEALRLGRPILLFIMGKGHRVLEDDIETVAAKKKKLNAFRERAKKMAPDSAVHRVYATFNSLKDFKERIGPSIADLRDHLRKSPQEDDIAAGQVPESAAHDPIPKPPALCAEPAYIGSHKFVGRQAELDVLSDWAQPADPHTILLFEAIGGNGKSMLTWEWTTKGATKVRTDWAGRFWYSFYERGAIMADFCQCALAYVTGQPLEEFHAKKTPELARQLLHHLQARPWLFVLDGLERVLVNYNRIDAASVPDEGANEPTDIIAARDPCAAIRPEDDDLLRALASAAPSKLLVTSRLVPRVLLNPASQPIPGVRRIPLPGLRPADAEALIRSCGITGESQAIQSYLTGHCDCHPLVIGVLAGLINGYLPDKGNFDVWSADQSGGGKLNLANLDLIQKRNHILNAGLDALAEKSRQLLSTLALLSEAADYPTLSAFNPHMPPEPELVGELQIPDGSPWWGALPDEVIAQAQDRYRSAIERRRDYDAAVEARLKSPEYVAAATELANTVRDLERRGLLQYDHQSKRYDLHPVVRGVATGRLRAEETGRYGQRVVDHFSAQSHIPCEQAETLEELRPRLQVVRTLIQMGRDQQAADEYRRGLGGVLYSNLGANAEILALLRPLFPKGWATLPPELNESDAAFLANSAGNALSALGQNRHAVPAYESAMLAFIKLEDWTNAIINLNAIAGTLGGWAAEARCVKLAIRFADVAGRAEERYSTRLHWYAFLGRTGRWSEADETWQILNGIKGEHKTFPAGYPEYLHAEALFLQGELDEGYLSDLERRAVAGKSRVIISYLRGLHGRWRLAQAQWALAAESLHEAVRMAHEDGAPNAAEETQLALAKLHLGQLTDPRSSAEQLAQARHPDNWALAEIWLAIGDGEQAKKHALAAYKAAWADGEPYVSRYGLNKAAALLRELGADIPKLAPYDPAKSKKLPWEDKVTAVIDKLRAKRKPKKASKPKNTAKSTKAKKK